MRWTMPAAMLLLAACGGGTEDQRTAEADAPATPSVPEAAPATPAPAQEGAPPPDYVADPSIAPPAAAEAGVGQGSATIPAAIRGRWGLVAADCTSTKGDAKGLLTIGPADLRFYESHGVLARIRERDAARIVADYKFSGEGMTWDRLMQLTTENGGRTLVRRDYGEGAEGGPLRYSRCV